LHILRLQ